MPAREQGAEGKRQTPLSEIKTYNRLSSAYFFHTNLLPVCKLMAELGGLSHLLFLATTLKL